MSKGEDDMGTNNNLAESDLVIIPMVDGQKEELFALFNDKFMLEYTNFNNFLEFTYSNAVFVNWNASVIIGNKETFDRCVLGKTSFKSWTEMYNKAVEVFKK
ncbi:hypothetical protein [Desulfosporosinus fructosivorans]